MVMRTRKFLKEKKKRATRLANPNPSVKQPHHRPSGQQPAPLATPDHLTRTLCDLSSRRGVSPPLEGREMEWVRWLLLTPPLEERETEWVRWLLLTPLLKERETEWVRCCLCPSP
jgi:hypothetical protein